MILGLSPVTSEMSSESEPEYNFGSNDKNCETFEWIWQDDNSELDTL
jgi:hypothetical protein